MTKTEYVDVRVAEALKQDVGRGVARISPDLAEELGLRTGDVVEIKGVKKTVAIYWRGFSQDLGRRIIRLDFITRKNAGVSIDDKVRIRKIEAKIATEIKLAPTQKVILRGVDQYLHQMLKGRVVTEGDLVPIPVGMGNILYFGVVSYKPDTDAVLADNKTRIIISENVLEEERLKKVKRVSYEDIGGLDEAIHKIREMIELPLRHPELFERLGIEPPKGVLLHGPPGTGKTLLAKAVASETNSHFISISGPEIIGKYYGESEERLRQVFEEAKRNAPSIIFIDEIDSIAPKREEATGEVERRVVAQLLALMDGLETRGDVVVIGATNRPNSIDPALRRGGRFDREIEIGIPDQEARYEILQIHTRGMPLADDVDLKKIASMTHGFVGADLSTLAKEAALKALKRILPNLDFEAETIPIEQLQQLSVTMEDMLAALKEIEPSALREVYVEVPDVKWEDIGGLEEIKKELKKAVEWPLKYGKVFEHMNAKPPKGILLYGPPGTGKTMLAKAVANESEANFISVKGPELLNKYVGESERAVREVFRKARQASPCIIFLDELDSLTPSRGSITGDSGVTERVISQLLTELDGIEELHGVTVIGATNRPDLIDPALLRPGRFDKLIEVGLPDEETRLKILQAHLRKTPVAPAIQLEEIAKRTEGFSGAELAGLVSRARLLVIEEFIDRVHDKTDMELALKNVVITQRHLEQALEEFVPSREKEKEVFTRKDTDYIS